MSTNITEKITPKAKHMVASDLSDTLLETATMRLGLHPQVTVQKENCMATSFSSETFDAVFAVDSVTVIGEKTKALFAIGRKADGSAMKGNSH